MIIDARTHLWTNTAQLGNELSLQLEKHCAPRWMSTVSDPDAHDRATKRIDVALVHGLHARSINAEVPTELIIDFCRRRPDKRLAVAGIDPLCPNAMNRLTDAIDLGAVAITVSPAIAGFHPTHSSAMILFEACEQKNLPVFFYNDLPLTSSSIMKYAQPSTLDEVARLLPNLKIILASGGYPWIDEAMVLCQKHKNVFCDTAGTTQHPWNRYQTLLAAHALGITNKLIFASGFPQEDPECAIESLYSTNTIVQGVPMPVVPRKSIRSIVEADLFTLLDIKPVSLQQKGNNGPSKRWSITSKTSV